MTELDELIECLEAVNWREVPGVSAPTAAVFTQQIAEARAASMDLLEAADHADAE